MGLGYRYFGREDGFVGATDGYFSYEAEEIPLNPYGVEESLVWYDLKGVKELGSETGTVDVYISVTTVPEPSTVFLLLGALLAVVFVRWRVGPPDAVSSS